MKEIHTKARRIVDPETGEITEIGPSIQWTDDTVQQSYFAMWVHMGEDGKKGVIDDFSRMNKWEAITTALLTFDLINKYSSEKASEFIDCIMYKMIEKNK